MHSSVARERYVPQSDENTVTCSPFFHRKQQRVHVRTAKREGAQGSDGRISVATQQHKQELDPSGCVLVWLRLRHENIDARRAGMKKSNCSRSTTEVGVHTRAILGGEESDSQQNISLAASQSSITTVCA
jgi:hypothetical protein